MECSGRDSHQGPCYEILELTKKKNELMGAFVERTGKRRIIHADEYSAV